MAVRAAPTLFVAGRLRLRCRARLLGLYDSSDYLDVQEDAPQLALVMVHDVTAGAQTIRMTGSWMYLHLSHIMVLICLLGARKML
ncbi:unnamed protein product [Acanthoscelides obtectus]|uniref:Uncharacterized protein n=1 Tax=Acanthoscelides obtectus TaxID=200917 RepID=A0A9P0L7E5_ACAOB|nr:unnamed protein product [Acanthoscelides obtectus]CAK1671055.1 hypothetical protein AOBTE_LOCUS28021 [Acanthoscelides obtectus]